MFGGAVLMDLSNTFDKIKYDFLIEKLYARDLSKNSLKFLHSYLSNWQHKKNISKQFTSWQELIQGVPYGSVLDPILFYIFVNDFQNLLTYVILQMIQSFKDLDFLFNRIE